MDEIEVKFTPQEIEAVLLALATAAHLSPELNRPSIKKHLTSFKAKARNLKVMAGTAASPSVSNTLHWQNPMESVPCVNPIILLERK